MDTTLLTLVNQGWTHPWLDFLMMGLTTLGFGLLGILTLVMLRRDARPLGWSLLLAQVAALLGVLVFYWLAGRTRPDAARLIMAAPPLPSFPSGHAAIAAATAIVWWLHEGWNRRTAAVVLLAVGVAYSRIYLGHHYPTDVVAGIVWGLGMGAAAHGITHHWGKGRSMVSWLLWPQIALAVMATFMAYLGLLPLYLLSWPYADKVLHMLLIGALAFWLNLWLPDWQLRMGRLRLPLAVALPFALAMVEEIMQSWSPLRTFDLGDLASDLVGLLFFYALSRWMLARMSPQVVVVRERF
ncbi:MAG: VanZ family protein [Caldilineaceae bacterium]|nr:VanZ family protein [Caldilineaceae bacterium]